MWTDLKYLFGLSINLEIASNNYAEYTAMVYALIMADLLGLKVVSIYTDSELVLTQVKGTAVCRNDILKQLLSRVHDLAFRFSNINLSFIEREYNTLADSLSKTAAEQTEHC